MGFLRVRAPPGTLSLVSIGYHPFAFCVHHVMMIALMPCPSAESAELFAVIAGLPRDVTIVFIEHDMKLVFKFAERITVMVGGTVLVEGTPDEIAGDRRVREVYLGEAEHA